MVKTFGPEELDLVKEMATVGAGNAATALSQMTGRRVSIEVPGINICDLRRANDVFGGAETLVASVIVRLLGDVSGIMMFTFKKSDALKFSNILLGKKGTPPKILGEMEVSAIKETATILAGSYLTAISKLFGVTILMSTPGFALDMAGAIADSALAETCKDSDQAIIIDTEITIVAEKIMGYYLFVPDRASLLKLSKSVLKKK